MHTLTSARSTCMCTRTFSLPRLRIRAHACGISDGHTRCSLLRESGTEAATLDITSAMRFMREAFLLATLTHDNTQGGDCSDKHLINRRNPCTHTVSCQCLGKIQISTLPCARGDGHVASLLHVSLWMRENSISNILVSANRLESRYKFLKVVSDRFVFSNGAFLWQCSSWSVRIRRMTFMLLVVGNKIVFG